MVPASFMTVEHMWVEKHHGEKDACDVLVRLEDGSIFTATFVTLAYLQRQMELTHELSKQIDDTVPARFAVIDVSHVLVDNLNRESIEDTIDNLIAMETFESVFTRVTENDAETTTTSTTTGTRATQEVAAVVLSDVLMVED
jgi:hypothetical protein